MDTDALLVGAVEALRQLTDACEALDEARGEVEFLAVDEEIRVATAAARAVIAAYEIVE